MAFDALVMRNPLYEPRTSDLTPEALSAFRTSQRLQLPAIAQRNYERAKAALASGDADRALALAKEAMAILDKRVGDFRPQLREDVEDLLAQAQGRCSRRQRDHLQRDRRRRHPAASVEPPDAGDRSDWRSAEPCGLAGHGHRQGRQRLLCQAAHAAEPTPRADDRQPRQGVALPAGDQERRAGHVSHPASKVNLPESGTD